MPVGNRFEPFSQDYIALKVHFPKPPRQLGLLSIGSSFHWVGALATIDKACTPDLSSSVSIAFTKRCLCNNI